MDLPFALERVCGGENLDNIIPVSVFRSTFGQDYGVTILDGAFQGLLSRSVVVSPSNSYKVSIQDMIGGSKKKEGLEAVVVGKLIVPNLEKPTSFSIPKDKKPRSFIE